MWSIYREVRGKIPAILKRCGTRSVSEARVFEEISFAANLAAGGTLSTRWADIEIDARGS